MTERIKYKDYAFSWDCEIESRMILSYAADSCNREYFKSSCRLQWSSLAWPDPLRPGAYRLEIISAGAYNF